MLLSSLFSALTLGACLVQGTFHQSPVHQRHPSHAPTGAFGASLSTHFDASIGTIGHYRPTFTQACQEKKPEVLIHGLADIKASISLLGSADVLAQADINILTTKVLNLMVELQVILKIIDEHKFTSSCSSAIVDLKASLQVMISVVASHHTDLHAKCTSAGVDLGFYARVGIRLDLGAQVSAGTGAGVGAGADVDASVKVVADLQASIGVTADLAPKFKSACEQKNVDVLVNGLASIKTSIIGLQGIHANVFAHVHTDVLSSHVLDLFVKIQVLLRLISDHNLKSQCQGAIVSLQAPLRSIVASVGVDVCAKISSSVDVKLFAQVGLDVGINANVAAGVGTGGIVSPHSNTGVQVDISAKVVTDLHASTSLMQDLEPKFKTACAQKSTDVLVSGLASIKASIAALDTSASIYAKVDADILTTNVLGLFVKLQVLLRIISDSKMSASCHDGIVALQAPLKAIVSVVASVGINISAKISAAVDVNLFTQIGLNIGINAVVGLGAGVGTVVGAGVGTGAGVNVGATAKILADFKASTGAAVTLAPTFKTACEQKNVAVLNQGLVSIVASVASVGAHADVLAHVTADDLCSQYFDLLIKLQVLLKIIDQHSLTSACKGSIVSLNAPLKALLTVLVSVGIDVSVKAKAYASLDLGFFANVGINLDIHAGASIAA